MNEETKRLKKAKQGTPWKKWGPYLSEREWGTVREDKSDSGDAWNYFSHDHARSKAYEWGEDGIAGISDDKQILCFSPTFWNGKDPILKERLFGITNEEGNHGEDVKEYYFYADSTPTHSYMKYIYKYPTEAYPYDDIVKTNRKRKRSEYEYELADTKIFDENKYFDIVIEYAKKSPEEIYIKISAENKSKEKAELIILPTVWFRNRWFTGKKEKPFLSVDKSNNNIYAKDAELGERYIYFDSPTEIIFTDNETNAERFFDKNENGYWKDGFHDYLIHDKQDKIKRENGTKGASVHKLVLEAGKSMSVKVIISDKPQKIISFTDEFESVFSSRITETNIFYEELTPDNLNDDDKQIMREALGGMFWSKQFFNYNVIRWREIDGKERKHPRNKEWTHLFNEDIISMPDKWEYPWYAAWDLAFHTIPIGIADIDFAKDQLMLMLKPNFMHPNGQIPAYEWNFSDVNPPVHAWATYEIFKMEKEISGVEDINFLKYSFHKLLMNFTWWVNRKDDGGNNLFEGGFLGLDNIGVFDRSAPLPNGGKLEQADGTAWMCFYSLEMMKIAVELTKKDSVYEDLACKFYEHFIYVASAMNRMGIFNDELWDEKDSFFYDLLSMPGGESIRLKVKSMVGLVSIFATAVFREEDLDKLPVLKERMKYIEENRPELLTNISHLEATGEKGRRLIGILKKDNLQKVLERLLDEKEFLSDFGIRSLSKFHQDNPFIFQSGREAYRVDYEPAESSTGLFGGNSNWRGPIWMPVNYLIIRGLLQLYLFYGDTIKVPIKNQELNLWGASKEISERLINIFRKAANGNRPVYGGRDELFKEEDFKKHILFYEYFNGEDGSGMGASHQTGWTGLVARLIQFYGSVTEKDFLERGDTSGMFYKED